MTVKREENTGLSFVRLQKQDLEHLPSVELPEPEDLPAELMAKIKSSQQSLGKEQQQVH
jgi:hypothetical protein